MMDPFEAQAARINKIMPISCQYFGHFEHISYFVSEFLQYHCNSPLSPNISKINWMSSAAILELHCTIVQNKYK